MEPRSRIVVLSVAVIALLVVGLIFFHYIPDDTYIGLRYARNLLDGKGLVFNEGVPLEGYTNFLWLMIVALAGRLGAPLVGSARVLGLLFSLATLVVAGYAAWARYPRDRSTWNHALGTMLGPLVLAASAPFLVWSLSGTEIPLFTFLLLAGFVLLTGGSSAEGIFAVFGLLGLVRPEGLLFYALAGLILLARGGGRRRVLIAGIGVLAILYGPYIVWKIHYFGSVLPNTFHAKTGPFGIMIRNGSRYLWGFLLRYGYFLVIGLFLNGTVLRNRERVLIPAAFVAVHWIAILILGGDWMPHYRLLVPTMPIMALLVSGGIGEVETVARREMDTAAGGGAEGGAKTFVGAEAGGPGREIMESAGREAPESAGHHTRERPERRPQESAERWRNPVPVVVVLLVFLAMVPGGIGYRDFLAERVTVSTFAHLGEYLWKILPPETSIGCGSTGAIGYYTGMRIVDILGLTEAHIAREGEIAATQPGHMKTDGAYVLDQEPDLLLLGNIQIHRGRRDRSEMKHKVQEQQIVVRPRFLKEYEFVNIPLTDGFYLSCYKRKSYFLPLE